MTLRATMVLVALIIACAVIASAPLAAVSADAAVALTLSTSEGERVYDRSRSAMTASDALRLRAARGYDDRAHLLPARLRASAGCHAARAADKVPQFRVRNAGPNRPGTRVPESFDLDVAGSSYRVRPNATKHLAEYARKHSSSGEFPTSPIAGAVEQAQRQGMRPGRNFGRYGDFELGIDAKDNVIYHLVYRPSRSCWS